MPLLALVGVLSFVAGAGSMTLLHRSGLDLAAPFQALSATQDRRGVVTGFDQTAYVVTIDGVDYTVAEGVVWPVDLIVNDSVSYKAEGTVVSALDKIRRDDAFADGDGDAGGEMRTGILVTFDPAARLANVSGTEFVVAEGVVWPVDLSMGDYVTYTHEGTVITSLDKVRN